LIRIRLKMESGEEEDLSMDTQPETGLLDIG
jgi:hypothetical protein